MLRGVYTAASAMSYQLESVGVLAHNMANAGTTGYKRSELMAKSFPELLIQMGLGGQSRLGLGVGAEQALVDMSQGAMAATGRNLDIAIDGSGYFQVRKPNGQLDITRNGSFVIDNQRRLATPRGELVLGSNDQPIQFVEGIEENIRINDAGVVMEGDQQVATLKIIEGVPTNQGLAPQLQPFVMDIQGQGAVQERSVRQGFLEESNVSVVKEMVALLHSQKSYDVGQKLIQTSDKMTDKVINEMGRS